MNGNHGLYLRFPLAKGVRLRTGDMLFCPHCNLHAYYLGDHEEKCEHMIDFMGRCADRDEYDERR